MTGRGAQTVVSLALTAVFSAAAVPVTSRYPIETPIQPKLDVRPFSRVFVAGFLTAGTQDVDGNLETVRLLRSQLRNKGQLRVIDADALDLADVAGVAAAPRPVPRPTAPPARRRRNRPATPPISPTRRSSPASTRSSPTRSTGRRSARSSSSRSSSPARCSSARTPAAASSSVSARPSTRSAGARVQPERTYMERKGFILRPNFIFIDGRTGETLHTETFREEILYNATQSTPALSSYFELMDRLLPSFLNTLSAQKVRGSRTLLQ